MTDRNNIKTGPAILTWDSAVLYFKDGISIDEEVSTFGVGTDAMTMEDLRVADRMATFSGTPVGAWKDLSKLYPHLSLKPGASLHGAADKAAVIHFLDEDRFTYHNVALTKMPSLFFSPTKTLLGPVEFTARTKRNVAASTANSFVTRDTAAFTDDSFDLAEILTQAYTLNWGADPWDAFDTLDGVEINATTQWQEIVSDSLGYLDQRLVSLEVAATFNPLAIAQASIDAKMLMQGAAGAVRGARRSGVATDFVLSATGVHVILRNAIARKAQLRSGNVAIRQGTMEAVAMLGVTAGLQVAPLYVGTAAPEEE